MESFGRTRAAALGGFVGDPIDQRELIHGIERGAEYEHLVERRAQGVEVASSVGHAAESLGRHVAERADHVARVRQVVAFLELRQAEVGDPYIPQRVEQQVRRLDIAVENAPSVGMGQRVGNLGSEPGDFAVVADLGLPGQRRRRGRLAGISAVLDSLGDGGSRAGPGPQWSYRGRGTAKRPERRVSVSTRVGDRAGKPRSSRQE